MKDITVDRLKLIDILKANREKHQTEFAEAEAAFRQTAMQLMRENLRKAEDGGEIEKHIACDTPHSYVKEYNRAIGMLEMEMEPSVSLTAHDYSQFVEDEWSWSNDFRSTTMSYNNVIPPKKH